MHDSKGADSKFGNFFCQVSFKTKLFLFWDQFGPKKVLANKIAKKYYRLPNLESAPLITHICQVSFKIKHFLFWDQIGLKKVLGKEISKLGIQIRNQQP